MTPLILALLACAGPPDGDEAADPLADLPQESVADLDAPERLPDVETLEIRPEGRRNGELAPDADLFVLGLQGEQVRLSRYVGPDGTAKVAIVAFMASWCGACDASLPTLKALEDTYGPDELVIVHMNVDATQPGREVASRRIRAAGLRGPILVAHPPVQRAWMGNSSAVPRYFFVNRIGQILVQDRGFDDKVADLMPRQMSFTLKNPGWTER